MSMVEVEAIRKEFRSGTGETVVAVDDLRFDVERGELYTLLGPSGCGKTTTLRSIAGYEDVDAGRININGEAVSDPENGRFTPPENRDIGFVFQSYAIWPHMTARENIVFALKHRGYPKEKWDQRVEEVLDLVGLPDIQDRYPNELSGGQQQRVSFARAIAPEPSILLMDEPLSNLDFQQRKRMRQQLLEILDEVNITTIYVTHDQEEAFEISDKIAVLKNGHLLQEGVPKALYSNPKTPFVANFIGDANVVDVNYSGDCAGDHVLCRPDGHEDVEFRCSFGTDTAPDRPVMVVQPKHVQLDRLDDEQTAADGQGGTYTDQESHDERTNTFAGTIENQIYRGGTILHSVRVGDLTLTCSGDVAEFEAGVDVQVTIEPERCFVIGAYR